MQFTSEMHASVFHCVIIVLRMAAILRWYYAKAASTGQDWFVLPPSGTLYSYPGEFSPALQREYAAATNAAAAVLDTGGSADWCVLVRKPLLVCFRKHSTTKARVEWRRAQSSVVVVDRREFIGGWKRTVDDYFPLFINSSSAPNGEGGAGSDSDNVDDAGADARGVKLFFLDQVPSALPIWPGVLPQSSVVLGDPKRPSSVVLVQPPLSVASGGTWDHSSQKPSAIATQLNRLRKGEVTYVYCITGNSAPQADFLNMTRLLDEHVEIVGYEQLASLARQRAAILGQH